MFESCNTAENSLPDYPSLREKDEAGLGGLRASTNNADLMLDGYSASDTGNYANLDLYWECSVQDVIGQIVGAKPLSTTH